MGIQLFPVYDIGTKVVEHFKLPNLQNDNVVFRLHYLFTVGILFLGSLLVTTGQYFGSPISCLVKGKTIPEEVMNTYCWIHSTFTLPKNVTMASIGTQYAHPGVGTYQETDTVVHSTYYQWVAYTLFFQGCCFAAPIYLWRFLEMGRMKRIIPENLLLKDYHSAGVCFKPPSLLKGIEKELAIAKMKDHFITRSNRIENRLYLHKYALCELLNFINVVIQITLLDFFLGGMFSTYGSDVFRISQMDPEERNDPMDRVFPKVGKCTFHKFGPSGSIMTSDALCILPLNIINEKIYVLVWYWFMFLAVVSGMQMLWRISTFFLPQVRQHYLKSKTSWNAGNAEVEIIVAKLSFGDWFTLTNISENIDDRMFTKLISELATSFRKIYPQESVGNSVSTAV